MEVLLSRILAVFLVLGVMVQLPACWQDSSPKCADSITSPSFAAQRDQSAAAIDAPEIKQAEQLLRRGELAAAREKLSAACSKDHRLAPAGVMLARWFLVNRKTDLARLELEQAAF